MKLGIAKKIVEKWQELELNTKQIKFLANYIENNCNGRKAIYLTEGYNPSNDNVADAMASQTLRIIKVREAFDYWKKNFLNGLKDKLEPILADQYFRRATYDITTFQNDDGTFKNLNQIPKEWRCCIDGVERKYYGRDADVCVVVSKLADKDRSMEKLSKYIDMIKDSLDIHQDVVLNITLENEEENDEE